MQKKILGIVGLLFISLFSTTTLVLLLSFSFVCSLFCDVSDRFFSFFYSWLHMMSARGSSQGHSSGWKHRSTLHLLFKLSHYEERAPRTSIILCFLPVQMEHIIYLCNLIPQKTFRYSRLLKNLQFTCLEKCMCLFNKLRCTWLDKQQEFILLADLG